ncbi:MAG: class I SAM-dependent methyltransferase [Acidobacteria bacterium]|nr:class I SAM-dependent methyltransferase [Acidobacteriota bacterium]
MESVSDFYDRWGDRYDDEMSTPLAREVRRAFWGQLDRFAPAEARVLDFGCGTGVDAEHYALSGKTVVAYDVSASMLTRLRERCAAYVEAGRVVIVEGPIERLHAVLAGSPPVTALTASFAVLNLLPDLSPVADLVGRRLPSLQTIVVSVQNPFTSTTCAAPGGGPAPVGSGSAGRSTHPTARARPAGTRRRGSWRPSSPSSSAPGCPHSGAESATGPPGTASVISTSSP